MLQFDAEPEGLVEKAGDAIGVTRRRAKGDLQRFKGTIEERGTGQRAVARRWSLRTRRGSAPAR